MTFVIPTDASIAVEIPQNFFDSEAFDRLMEKALEDVVLEAGSFWETTAGQRLNTSRARYLAAIDIERTGQMGWNLNLTTPFAVSIETGWTAPNQKPRFLASPKIKFGPVKKIPRAIAATLTGTKPAASRWMIIPLHTHSGTPQAYRTFTDKQPDLWPKNAKTRRGVHIIDDVVVELDEILERHVMAVIDAL